MHKGGGAAANVSGSRNSGSSSARMVAVAAAMITLHGAQQRALQALVRVQRYEGAAWALRTRCRWVRT